MTGSLERSLVVLKPDAVSRGLVGAILARFESSLLKIVGAKFVRVDDAMARSHYLDLEERLGSEVFQSAIDYLQQGPVFALVLEGADCVATIRKLVGSTYPNEANPGTIRGDYAHQSKAFSRAQGIVVANLVHASGTTEEGVREVDLWFGASELLEYETLAQRYYK